MTSPAPTPPCGAQDYGSATSSSLSCLLPPEHERLGQSDAGTLAPGPAGSAKSRRDRLPSHGRIRSRPVGRHLAMLDQPRATVRYQGVAIAAHVVEADMGDDGEIARHLRMVSRYLGEEH